MSASKKTIQFTAVASIILLIITYLVTVNIDTNLLTVDSPWISNSFLLTFFGGAFASMAVVLMCEISKYWQAKQSAETYLFSHLCYLYGQLQILSHNIKRFLSQKGKDVSREALTKIISNAEAEMNALYFAEYAPFCKSNAVLGEKLRFNSEIFSAVQSVLKDCRMLDIALNRDEIARLEVEMGKREQQELPEYTLKTLERLSSRIIDPLNKVDQLAAKIDTLCNGRCKWNTVKTALLQGFPDNQPDYFEQFLSKE